MKLYLPKGGYLTKEEELKWINHCNELTLDFNNRSQPIPIKFDTELYLSFRNNFDYSKFITPMWAEHYARAEQLFLSGEDNFLADDLIRYAFFFSGGGIWQRTELDYLESKLPPSRLSSLLHEDNVFSPTITSAKYNSSECLIHHLTHFTFFQEKTNQNLYDLRTIIEFGGGYGGMCRLARRLTHPVTTHIIIDLPIFSFIQHSYLSAIYGSENTILHIDSSSTISPGKVNLVPITNHNLISSLPALNPDLFVATWSLSETNQYTLDYINNFNFFDSRYLLMAYRCYNGNVNPRQPISDKLQADTAKYLEIYRDNTFYCLDNEQHYYFCQSI